MGVDTLAWAQETHEVTKGQPYEGTSVINHTIDVVAGHKGSKRIAQDFSSGLQVINTFVTRYFINIPHLLHFPGQLHFLTVGNLTVTVKGKTHVCPNMRIGQGHVPLTWFNNYWFGAPYCTYRGDLLQGTAELDCSGAPQCGILFRPAVHPAEGVFFLDPLNHIHVYDKSDEEPKGEYGEHEYDEDLISVSGSLTMYMIVGTAVAVVSTFALVVIVAKHRNSPLFLDASTGFLVSRAV